MPKCTIDGKEIEVPRGDDRHPGRGRARDPHPPLLLAPRPAGGRQLPHVPGRDREDAQAPDRLQHAGDRGHGGAHEVAAGGGGPAHDPRVPARSTTRSTARCATRPASATCRTSTWTTGSTTRRWSSRTRSASARWWTSGRSCSTPSAACCARAASASSARSRGRTCFEFVNRGDHTQIATFENRPITHDYAGNLADVCPVGALPQPRLPLQDAGLVPEDRTTRSAPAARPAATSSWTSATARCSACGRGATPTSTSPGCATPAAPSTSRSRSRRRVSGARVRGGAGWEGVSVAAALDRVAAALKDAGAGRRLPRLPAGDERGRVRVQGARGRRGRQARLPGRGPAEEGPRADRRRPAARRPQPEHAGLPRPGRGPGRRRRDPRRLPRRLGPGARPPGPGAAPGARGGRRDREGALRRGDGHPRGARARPRHRRPARRPVGRGRGHVHELRAAGAAAEGGGAAARRRAAAVGARRGRPAAARPAARRRHRARGVRAPREGDAGLRRPRLPGARRARQALAPAEGALPAQEARA